MQLSELSLIVYYYQVVEDFDFDVADELYAEAYCGTDSKGLGMVAIPISYVLGDDEVASTWRKVLQASQLRLRNNVLN